jgi:hypothetical protein
LYSAKNQSSPTFADLQTSKKALRPLGVVKPAAIASDANVLVTIARGDQLHAPVNAREMAKKLGWKYQSVFANRHLVVGIDRAITQTVMDFLAGER